MMLQYVSLVLGNILIVSVSLGYVLIMICRCFVFSPIQKNVLPLLRFSLRLHRLKVLYCIEYDGKRSYR